DSDSRVVIWRIEFGGPNGLWVCGVIEHRPVAWAGSAFPASNINSIIDYSDRGSSAVHVMAGSSGSPRVTVWIVNKRLSYARAEDVQFSPRHGCGVMINCNRNRLRYSPRVGGWIIDLHCGRGVCICIITII